MNVSDISLGKYLNRHALNFYEAFTCFLLPPIS
jgi:hypothetical protein